jgi:large subunit ribosomal protein L15
MNLNEVHQGVARHRKRKRLGRGVGSGQGKTAGRGHKGQKARAGWKALSIWQGGMTPLVRQVPKRGFNNKFALTVAEVNVSALEAAFESGDEIGLEQLAAKGLVSGKFDVVKVLGNGELTKKLLVSAHRFSGSAKEKIEKAGGETRIVPGKTPVAVKQKKARLARQSEKK